MTCTFTPGCSCGSVPSRASQRAQVELIREALNDALHQVLLCNVVLAGHHLLHHAWLHQRLHRVASLIRHDQGLKS